jgi:hypothetical protein
MKRTKPKRKLSPRQWASIRLAELIRLQQGRKRYGIEIDQNAWLFVVCHTLAPLRERDGGLDLYHLNEFTNRHNMSLGDNAAAVKTIHNVCDYRAAHPYFRGLSRKTAAKMLDITADERWRHRIKTMDAVDETVDGFGI